MDEQQQIKRTEMAKIFSKTNFNKFGPGSDSNFFSETEKSEKIEADVKKERKNDEREEVENVEELLGEKEEEEKGKEEKEEMLREEVERAEERCSELWNQIKDAAVLDGQELSHSLLARFQRRADLLGQQVIKIVDRFPPAAANLELRFECFCSALDELKRKKKAMEMENGGEDGEENKNMQRERWKGRTAAAATTKEFGAGRGGEGGPLALAAAPSSADVPCHTPFSSSSTTSPFLYFRKWLHRQELELERIRQRVPSSRNSLASLRDLEREQKTLQEQIQKEGRAKHQQICSGGNNTESSRQNRLCESLEQRYLALWLASLENLELICHFKAVLTKKCLENDEEQEELLLLCSSELEDGPDPKRRRTTADWTERGRVEEGKEKEEEQQQFDHIQIVMSSEKNSAKNLVQSKPQTQFNIAQQLTPTSLAMLKQRGGAMETGKQQQQLHFPPLGSDIGYSSGENNSVHEGTINTQSIGGDLLVFPPWAEQIARSSELEKSFYRTVPLDDFGMTDLDTDEGGRSEECWRAERGGGGEGIGGGGVGSSSFLAQKFLVADFDNSSGSAGSGPARPELSDSLIVHVDTPESRQLNDFEEVMDLLDSQHSGIATEEREKHQHLPFFTPVRRLPFSEDDCESLSTTEDGETPMSGKRPTRVMSSRKRTLAKSSTAPIVVVAAAAKTKTNLLEQTTPRQKQQSARRKWAAVRRVRRSVANNWNHGNCGGLSSDFEWDEDTFLGETKRGWEKDEDEEETQKGIINAAVGGRSFDLPEDIERVMEDEEEDEEEEEEEQEKSASQSFLSARKKALRAFRNGLKQAAAESGNVSARLRELLALVDKSLGGVDSATILLSELRSTFASLSRLCHSLDEKLAAHRREKEGEKREEEKEDGEENNAKNSFGAAVPSRFRNIESELTLCQERMNALETTCNSLALFLSSSFDFGEAVGDVGCGDKDYLSKFATECSQIKEELKELKNRFGDRFFFCSINFNASISAKDVPSEFKSKEDPKLRAAVDCSAQTSAPPPSACKSTATDIVACFPPQQQQQKQIQRRKTSPAAAAAASFWRSYLLMCLIGLFASVGTLLYANSRDGADWRWTFGPQLHYENGPPPI